MMMRPRCSLSADMSKKTFGRLILVGGFGFVENDKQDAIPPVRECVGAKGDGNCRQLVNNKRNVVDAIVFGTDRLLRLCGVNNEGARRPKIMETACRVRCVARATLCDGPGKSIAAHSTRPALPPVWCSVVCTVRCAWSPERFSAHSGYRIPFADTAVFVKRPAVVIFVALHET